MQVQNITPINHQSFGMALKVKPEDMKAFTEYISKNTDLKTAQRGITQLIKSQKNNKHFDIIYKKAGNVIKDKEGYSVNMDAFIIQPKTDLAKSSEIANYIVRGFALATVKNPLARKIAKKIKNRNLKTLIYPQGFLPLDLRHADWLTSKENKKLCQLEKTENSILKKLG